MADARSQEAGQSGSRRVALVIGNTAYPGAPLRNPENDARDIAAALRQLGFEVLERLNMSQRDMNRAIAQFGEKLNGDTVALFYYAGHGMQVKGKNYLIPVDAQISSETSVRAETVDVDTVLDQLTASPMSIVILDACRNNPFERRFRSIGGGLAQMDAPKGSLIAYATAPGKTASDGDGRNGLYTQELLKVLNQPGLPLEAVFKRVRANVARATADAQMPWEASSLTGDFYFKAAPTQAAIPAAPQVASLGPAPALPSSGGISLDDIRQQQEARSRWEKWQIGMQADFDMVAALNVAPDLQAAAWDRFLANYSQKNPFSGEDDRLRAEASARKLQAEAKRTSRTTAADSPAPVKVASIAPAPPALAQGTAGEWEYVARNGEGKTRVLIERSKPAGALTEYLVDGRVVGEWSLGKGAAVVGLPIESEILFSSSLPAADLARAAIANQGWQRCTASLRCDIRADVAGKERITVPAGSFDVVRVEVSASLQGFTNQTGQIKASVWYSDQLKRVVRQQTTASGFGNQLRINETVELAASR